MTPEQLLEVPGIEPQMVEGIQFENEADQPPADQPSADEDKKPSGDAAEPGEETVAAEAAASSPHTSEEAQEQSVTIETEKF
jgi:hypothetical protein